MGFTTKVLDSMTEKEQFEYRCELIKTAIEHGYSWNWLAKNMNLRKSQLKKMYKAAVLTPSPITVPNN